MSITLNVHQCQPKGKPRKLLTKPKWEKNDKIYYIHTIRENIHSVICQPIEDILNNLLKTLHVAESRSMPNYGKLKISQNMLLKHME